MASIITSSDDDIKRAARKLADGGLVSFPTETVYGLGANALNVDSVLKIFEFKGRPLTDPVIVHVLGIEDAWPLTSIDDDGKRVMEALGRVFWPGPLTMVVPASTLVPPVVCANSGMVGIRVPNHPVARRLIKEAGVCVAAPSANRFGHVSPSKAVHVYNDLKAHDLLIIDGGNCSVGIESTVCKINVPEKEIAVLRQGGVSQHAIEAAVAAHLPDYSVVSVRRKASAADGNQVAPGQLLTHYAPDYPTYLYSRTNIKKRHQLGQAQLSKCVVIDYCGRMSDLKASALAYQDLSEAGVMSDAAKALFDTLRWSEGISGASAVLLPDLTDATDEMTAAVADRLYRAASGSRAWADADSSTVVLDQAC